MIKDVVKYPNSILREKSKSISDFGTELHGLVNDLTETVKHHNGLGISAVQIGILKRVFLSYVNGRIGVFVNPNIVEYKGKERLVKEGCLSLPGIMEETKRYPYLVIEYADYRGNACVLDTEKDIKDTEENKQLLSQVIAHENDHLLGFIFLDKFSHTKRELILKKMNNK